MKALDNYNQAKQEIFDYFGYEEDWVVYPLEDFRNCKWKYDASTSPREVHFWNPHTDLNENNEYMFELRYDRFLGKAIWVGDEYTMMCVDTHTDGNKYLAIFSNDNEIA